MKTPIITLHEPWATWIAKRWKLIETRTHQQFKSLTHKWIGIHAGLRWDRDALQHAGSYLTEEQIRQTKTWLRVGGCIIAIAYVSEHRKLDILDQKLSLICTGTIMRPVRYGLVFSDIRPIEAIPVRGRQGIWYHDIPDKEFKA